jgi:hypothetical protein
MDPELAALQQAIQMLHALMVHLSDPQAVAVVGKCLQALTGLQQQMMQGAAQGGGGGQGQAAAANPMVQALAQRLQGAGAGAP